MSEKIHGATGAFIIVGIVTMLAIVSCSEEEAVFEPAPFMYNVELVDPIMQIPELNLQFAPPAGWQALDSTQLDNFRRMLGGTDMAREFYPVFPLVVYADSTTGGLMYIAQVEESETGLPQIATLYQDFIQSKMATAAMTPANYIINDMKMYYYLLRSGEVINYKLIGETAPDKRFLIEYIIGGAVYNALEPTVSSSLSTLKPITAAPESPSN
jgi:hypothetical protein